MDNKEINYESITDESFQSQNQMQSNCIDETRQLNDRHNDYTEDTKIVDDIIPQSEQDDSINKTEDKANDSNTSIDNSNQRNNIIINDIIQEEKNVFIEMEKRRYSIS